MLGSHVLAPWCVPQHGSPWRGLDRVCPISSWYGLGNSLFLMEMDAKCEVVSLLPWWNVGLTC